MKVQDRVLFQDEILGSESDSYTLLMPIFAPVYMNLVHRLLKKSEYPPDEEYGSWHEGSNTVQHTVYYM